MNIKALFLVILTLTAPLLPAKTHARVSPEAATAMSIVGGVIASVGTYFLGKHCDWWGNPNPEQVICESSIILNDLYNQFIVHEHYLYQPIEVTLPLICDHTVPFSGISYFTKRDIASCIQKLNDCLIYAEQSRHYAHRIDLHDNLRHLLQRARGYEQILCTMQHYVQKHAAGKNLLEVAQRFTHRYSYERSLYHAYAFNIDMARQSLYAYARSSFKGCDGEYYGLVHYGKRLTTDLQELQQAFNSAHQYPTLRAQVQELLEALNYMHHICMSDPYYHTILEQYRHFKREQERLERERQRIELDRIQQQHERYMLDRQLREAEEERIRLEHQRREQRYAEEERLRQQRLLNQTRTRSKLS